MDTPQQSDDENKLIAERRAKLTAMRELGPAILAQRRAVGLIKDWKDPDKLLSAFEQSEAHTQLGILLTTRGSVVNSTADHVEAAREFSRARELSPADPYPRA